VRIGRGRRYRVNEMAQVVAVSVAVSIPNHRAAGTGIRNPVPLVGTRSNHSATALYIYCPTI